MPSSKPNPSSEQAKAAARWRADPVAFVHEVSINPETGSPFELYAAEIEFLRRALVLTPDGRLPFPEMLYSAPKKSGKTALAAMVAIYVAVVIGGPYAEVYALANDYDQAVGRVFQAAARIVQASPLLRNSAKVTADRITFISTGAFISAVANDFKGFAGANPTLTVWDELWAFASEASHRLWDEGVFSPTRKVSGRLTVTYAGFEGESELLEGLYKRGIAGKVVGPDLYEQPGMLAYWTHTGPAPWQTDAWREQMRQSTRQNAYLRHVENRWVTSESEFVPIEWWDACVDSALHPILADQRLPVWVGVDASVKRDSTAIVVCGWDRDAKKVRLVWHRIFQPSPDDPLDFEATIERTLLEMRTRFSIREVRYDPYQLVAVAQRLRGNGLPMIEFPQSVPNLTEASSNLYEIIKGANLILYPDADMRLSISRCVALETTRGWRIAKEKTSHKIDVIVALAQAALGAVQEGQRGMDASQWAAVAVGLRVPGVERRESEIVQNLIRRERICGKCKRPVMEKNYLTDGGARFWHRGPCPEPDGPPMKEADPAPASTKALDMMATSIRGTVQQRFGPGSIVGPLLSPR
ncbi:MAG TPA: terminase large subunit [Candidatus Binataceae bacterium]|nr:terminase large subunit [Candidatus Binataceae bacterium]